MLGKKTFSGILQLLTSACLFISLNAFSQKDTAAIRFSNTITADALETHLTILASDSFEGRETGKKGQKLAADYIQAQFKSFGIPPYKEDTYYQTYPLELVLPKAADIKLKGKLLEPKKDFYHFPGLSEQNLETKEILFLGYGIDDAKYSDYAGNNVKDKVVMILSGEPYGADGNSLLTGKKEASLWSSYYKNKIQKAREQGAKMLLVVVEDMAKSLEQNKHRLESSSLRLNKSGIEMPVIYISKDIANSIFKKTNTEEVKKKISESQKPLTFATKAAMRRQDPLKSCFFHAGDSGLYVRSSTSQIPRVRHTGSPEVAEQTGSYSDANSIVSTPEFCLSGPQTHRPERILSPGGIHT